MREYLARAHAALDDFDTAAKALATTAGSIASPTLSGRTRDVATALLETTAALRRSLDLTSATAVDISDLQVRLEDESRRLARHLKALGEAVEGAKGADRVAADALAPALRDLEERAQRVAAANFPSAIGGLREINKALWEMRIIWKHYSEILDRGVRGKLPGFTTSQLDAVDTAAREVLSRFDAVNDLLNQLLTTPLIGDKAEATQLVNAARVELKAAVKRARMKAAAYKPFHGVLGRAEHLAERIFDLFDEVRVPVFPAPASLGAFSSYIDHARYRSLAGIERFALMNIGSRLNSIPLRAGATETLAAERFEIRVFEVFADRVYFTARTTFLDAVKQLHADGVFDQAPAGLHRFHDGSYKQRQRRKGNLQVSYAAGSDTDPTDATRICVDADIDLYRGSVSHLFGEVLVNHLTGSKTDQFRVWDTLVENHVTPLGGFDVIDV